MKSNQFMLLLVALLIAVFVANAWAQSSKIGKKSVAFAKEHPTQRR